jgi:O-antigen ligase
VLATILLVVVPFVAFSRPASFATLTGRPSAQLALTSSGRTTAWSRAIDVASEKPVFGAGPGQSSVLLARFSRAKVLISSQGIWAAALLDTGAVGLLCVLVLLVGPLAVGAAWVCREPTMLGWALLASALAAVLSTMIAGDRIEVSVWVALGLLAAVATRRPAD